MLRCHSSFAFVCAILAQQISAIAADHPQAALQITSLTNPAVRFRAADMHHAVLKRDNITTVIVDNAARPRDQVYLPPEASREIPRGTFSGTFPIGRVGEAY